MHYRFGDLVLASDFPCPHLPEVAGGRADCSFRLAPPAGRPAPAGGGHVWRDRQGDVSLACWREDESYRLEMPGLATFTIDPGARRITGSPIGPQSLATMEHLLIDQVLPRVLAQRGRLVLHAGAVVAASGAIAFLGESGAGKSTLCAAFARAGTPLIGDDGIVVGRCAGGGCDIVPTYAGLRLLPPSLSFLGACDRIGPRVAGYTGKRRVHPVNASAGPVPLRAIYALAEGERVTIAAIAGAAAVMALVRSTFHLHLDDAARARSLFETLAEVARIVPVRELSYPRAFDQLDAVREAVLADAASVQAA